jgi:hypothetical protein
MGTLIGMLAGKTIFGKTITEPVARFMLTAGLVLAVLAVLGGIVAFIRHDAVADHQAAFVKRAAPATDQAAAERATDTIAVAKQEQEAHDVIHSVPDAAPSAPSHALACKRLHDLGRDPPACR